MKPIFHLKTVVAVLAFLLLTAGCTPSMPLNTSTQQNPAEQRLSFVDIGKFDRDLANSLTSDLPEVEVHFYNNVSPNKIPDRVQWWISAVENTGGKVKVENPANEPASRSILPLFSLLGTAYSTFKDKLFTQPNQYLNAAKGRNAVIELQRGPSGDLLVNKIKFIK